MSGTLAKPKVTHDIIECIARHIDDSLTWCRFAQVSRKTKQVTDRLLIKLENKGKYRSEYHTIPGLPHGLTHGSGKIWNCNDRLIESHTNKDGQLHGKRYRWDHLGRPICAFTYKNGVRVGRQETWTYHGKNKRDERCCQVEIFSGTKPNRCLSQKIYVTRRQPGSPIMEFNWVSCGQAHEKYDDQYYPRPNLRADSNSIKSMLVTVWAFLAGGILSLEIMWVILSRYQNSIT